MENTIHKQLSSVDYKNYFLNGIAFNTYLTGVEKDAALNITEGNLAHVPMNLQRMKRIMKTIRLSDETKQAIANLKNKKHWLLITEHWCGDASQISPVINAFAENSDEKIELRIAYRDNNPELIDAHLTNSARAIPILIQLNENFEVTGKWGPRPPEAQTLVKELKSNPETEATYAEHLHKWYAQDKQTAIQHGLTALIKK